MIASVHVLLLIVMVFMAIRDGYLFFGDRSGHGVHHAILLAFVTRPPEA
jgi:hypothetical protein